MSASEWAIMVLLCWNAVLTIFVMGHDLMLAKAGDRIALGVPPFRAAAPRGRDRKADREGRG